MHVTVVVSCALTDSVCSWVASEAAAVSLHPQPATLDSAASTPAAPAALRSCAARRYRASTSAGSPDLFVNPPPHLRDPRARWGGAHNRACARWSRTTATNSAKSFTNRNF